MRHESAYVRDALRAIDELDDFVRQTSRERFLSNPLEQSYVFHRLVIFGEAMNRPAGSFQAQYPALPWVQIIALRNRLVHRISISIWNSSGESPARVWKRSGWS
jgi:uncharacterized protein with HEPN domain